MIEVSIIKNSVMAIVEGLSVIIAQKNGGESSFESLWASKDERRKLDIYYRESIGDLERKLIEWLKESHSQFTLRTDGKEEDYILKIKARRYWPMRLQGLLANRVQDFMVHSITASWLSDFSGIEVKSDYAGMAANDLEDIRTILEQREFGFDDKARGNDPASKSDNDAASAVVERREDDCYHDSDGEAVEVRSRHEDDAIKDRSATTMPEGVSKRHRDDAPVHCHHESIDWSGLGPMDFIRPMGPVSRMDPAGLIGLRKSPPLKCQARNEARNEMMRPRPNVMPPKPEDRRYTPAEDKQWYESLEEMGMPVPDRRGPDGMYMEKYRDLHEHEAMQEHDCGRAMLKGRAESDCGDHEETLEW